MAYLHYGPAPESGGTSSWRAHVRNVGGATSREPHTTGSTHDTLLVNNQDEENH